MASDNFHLRTGKRAFGARILSSTVTRCVCVIALISLPLFLAASQANATLYDVGYFVEATQASYDQLPNCTAPECTRYNTDGALVYTTDYAEYARLRYCRMLLGYGR